MTLWVITQGGAPPDTLKKGDELTKRGRGPGHQLRSNVTAIVSYLLDTTRRGTEALVRHRGEDGEGRVRKLKLNVMYFYTLKMRYPDHN